MPRTLPLYAVHVGHKPGVYHSWAQCRAQTRGVPGAKFKKFVGPDAKLLAEYFVQHGAEPDKAQRDEQIKARARDNATPSEASVDEGFFQPAEATGYEGLIDRKLEPFVVFTDGSVRIDEKTKRVNAGIGVWFGPSDRRNFGEPFRLADPTNNRCEIMASIRAIETINEMDDVPKTQEIVIGSDSQYVIHAMTKWWSGWESNDFKNKKGQPVSNLSLLKRLHALCQERPVSFYYTPGHVGIPGNEGADQLAALGGTTVDPGFYPEIK